MLMIDSRKEEFCMKVRLFPIILLKFVGEYYMPNESHTYYEN